MGIPMQLMYLSSVNLFPNLTGLTALMRACREGHTETVIFMLTKSDEFPVAEAISINVKDINERTALRYST